jgi:outer membrane lipoprotein-sorting protein
MKKIFAYLMLTLTSASAAFAQQDAQAKSILNGVSQKYRSYNTVKSDFTINIQSPQDKVNQTQSGTLYTLAKTNKYKLTVYGNAAKTAVVQEITSDGKTLWTYLPREKEVQVNDVKNNTEGLNPAQVFTIYEKGYKYIYTGLQKQGGKNYQAIELTPLDTKQNIFKVKLLIHAAKKQIYSAQLFDKNGSRYLYTINSLTPNPSVGNDVFTFNAKAHPGVEVVDLR